MNIRIGVRLVTALALCLVATSPGAKEVVGWIEFVQIYPTGTSGVPIKAKLDTGAKTSSLHCNCVTPVKRGGQEWVSFTVESAQGEILRLERPITRIAKIKQHAGESQRRYVISLGLCLGQVYREEEVTLVDRSGFNYPLLIGRNYLKGNFLVDPEETYKTQPNCKVPSPK